MQHLLRRFTIRTRMVGAIAMVLALLILVGGTGLGSLHLVVKGSEDMVSHSVAETNELSELRTAMGNLRRYEKDMIINYEARDKVKEYRGKWQQSLEEARKAIGLLTSGEEDDDNVVLRRMSTRLDEYAKLGAPVFTNLEGDGYDTATAANKLLGRAKEQIHLAEKDLDEVSAILKREAQDSVARNQSTERWAYAAVGLALALAVLVVVPLTLLNMVSICRPIAQAEGLARDIAGGRLDRRVPNEGDDEAAHLIDALSQMRESLARIVGEVRHTADSIQTASAEVAAGNQDLSQRTEHTASNLQQTASSVEQLASNVRQNADAAAQANQMANSASEAARRGGEVVTQVVTNMQDISTSSRRIADIIGTIDGIAFQTNILALNAAVEAARAGEQGRGFAVVAGEVRSLAQRSAEAAREIKSLIGASVEKVESGSRLVQDAGSTMSEIVQSVQRVTDIIGEISAATHEQNQGIGQVNTAVSQLDQMTQQNAALVEESAAAAASLSEQAQRLARTVAAFQLDDAPAIRPAASVAAPPLAPAPAPAPLLPPPAPAKMASDAIERARTQSAQSVTAAPSPRPASPPANDDWESF